LEVRSLVFGLAGVCDVVLWTPPAEPPPGVSLPEAWRRASAEERRRWSVVPVEYKRGRPKANDCDRVQLCGQALCLEEMLGVSVSSGQLFYGKTRRRTDVAFDEPLRGRVRALAARLHEMVRSGVTPPAVYEKAKCDRCSLKPDCLPELPAKRRSALRWLDRQLETSPAD
jgi:CRISPR-associated exonuclease Cas4